MESQIKYRFFKENSKSRFYQGDILKDVEILMADSFDEQTGRYSINSHLLRYGVLINQECDLEHDFNYQSESTVVNQDKLLPNLVILPAYLASEFRDGKHRDGMIGQKWNTDAFKLIRQNNNDRFAYIKEQLDYQIPELVIDFKHLYSINRNILYKKMDEVYLASTSEMFRESLSHRYCNYLCRIGLPEIS
jgi:hypothetical protein